MCVCVCVCVKALTKIAHANIMIQFTDEMQQDMFMYACVRHEVGYGVDPIIMKRTANRSSKQDFPTPESPIKSNLNR